MGSAVREKRGSNERRSRLLELRLQAAAPQPRRLALAASFGAFVATMTGTLIALFDRERITH